MTFPSRTIAKVPLFWFSAVVVSPNTFRAELLNPRLTAQPAPCGGVPYDADFSSVPSISALESRNFRPSSLQAISGSSGLSDLGATFSPLGGQVNFEYFCNHSTPGSCAHCSGLSTGAPFWVTWG